MWGKGEGRIAGVIVSLASIYAQRAMAYERVVCPALKELTRQLGIDTKKMIENHKDGTASRPKFQTIV